MKWIKKFNEMQRIKEDDAINLMCEHEKLKENSLDNIYREIYQLEYDINKLDPLSIPPLKLVEILSEMFDRFKDIRIECDGKVEILNQDFKRMALLIRQLQLEGIKECSEILISQPFGNSKYMKMPKDYDLFMKRIDIFKQRLINITDSLGIIKIGDFSIFNYVQSDLVTLSRIASKKIDKQIEKIEEFKLMSKPKFKYDKIFDYKKLCYMAEKSNYFYDRQTGDHLIYKHSKTGKIVPIPVNNELHFGIMRNIQKMIQNNSVA